MSQSTQSKFLRVLKATHSERVGGNVQIKVDVRVVAATNRQLEDAVRWRSAATSSIGFRWCNSMPPLRDRLDDVPLLADHFS